MSVLVWPSAHMGMHTHAMEHGQLICTTPHTHIPHTGYSTAAAAGSLVSGSWSTPVSLPGPHPTRLTPRWHLTPAPPAAPPGPLPTSVSAVPLSPGSSAPGGHQWTPLPATSSREQRTPRALPPPHIQSAALAAASAGHPARTAAKGNSSGNSTAGTVSECVCGSTATQEHAALTAHVAGQTG